MVDIDIAKLTEVDIKELAPTEALQLLLEGKDLIVTNYEKTRRLDVLVRMRDWLTEISYDTKGFRTLTEEPYWLPYDVPVNVFSQYLVYEHSKVVTPREVKFLPQETVLRASSAGGYVADTVKKVYIDEATSEVYYSLSCNENKLYSQAELK